MRTAEPLKVKLSVFNYLSNLFTCLAKKQMTTVFRAGKAKLYITFQLHGQPEGVITMCQVHAKPAVGLEQKVTNIHQTV